MDRFYSLLRYHFKLSMLFFIMGLGFGLYYALNLLGIGLDSALLLPSSIRSVHISLMLYGFIPLMLSFLPFLLIHKEVGYSQKGLFYLHLYAVVWYVFLVYMVLTLLFGQTRGLAFYDFMYELNFFLAFAGLFYVLALLQFLKRYTSLPLWVKVSLGLSVCAPVLLLVLMNPDIGQVESTVSGPHGDNTLGMSFALIPIYYLVFKLLSTKPFHARWHVFWIIPLSFYIASVLYRTFVGALSYEQEWFLQYLTLCYLPLLYRWFKDACLEPKTAYMLVISILAFLFVDVQGNILFIPEFRWLFHRNDLVVAHAHVAMGIGIFFMVIALYSNIVTDLSLKRLNLYLAGLLGIFVSLSLSGFAQAGFLTLETYTMWILRFMFGLLCLSMLTTLVQFPKNLNALKLYNLAGVLSDGLGGFILFLGASYFYPLLGWHFSGVYEYVVFAFVSTTGILHFFALQQESLTKLTALIRVGISGVFFSLYAAGILGIEALAICLFDLSFAFVYLYFFSSFKESKCNV